MSCLNCKEEGRQESHFCSDACKAAYMLTVDGPVDCFSSVPHPDCEHSVDTLKQAVDNGWVDLEPMPEESQCNYGGTCPVCKKLEDAES